MKRIACILCSVLFLTGCNTRCSRTEPSNDMPLVTDIDIDSGIDSSDITSPYTSDTVSPEDYENVTTETSGVMSPVSASDNDAILALSDVTVSVVAVNADYHVSIYGKTYNNTAGNVTVSNLPDIIVCNVKAEPSLNTEPLLQGSSSLFGYSCVISDVDSIDVSIDGVSGHSELGFVDKAVTEGIKRGSRDALDALPSIDLSENDAATLLAKRIATTMAYYDVNTSASDVQCEVSKFETEYDDKADTFNVSCRVSNAGDKSESVVLLVSAYDSFGSFVDSHSFEFTSISAHDTDSVSFVFGPYKAPADTLIDHFEYTLSKR